jgi:hypothetical protein
MFLYFVCCSSALLFLFLVVVSCPLHFGWMGLDDFDSSPPGVLLVTSFCLAPSLLHHHPPFPSYMTPLLPALTACSSSATFQLEPFAHAGTWFLSICRAASATQPPPTVDLADHSWSISFAVTQMIVVLRANGHRCLSGRISALPALVSAFSLPLFRPTLFFGANGPRQKKRKRST